MTFISESEAERALHSSTGRPGRPAISRTHPAYLRGRDDYYAGRSECPYLEYGEAARHWRAAQANAEHEHERYLQAMSEDRRV
jgi:hypothetical protein